MSRSGSPLRSFVRACWATVLLSLAACATMTPTARAPAGETRSDVVASPTVPDETPPPEPIRMPDPYAVPAGANGEGMVFSPSRIFDRNSFQSGVAFTTS